MGAWLIIPCTVFVTFSLKFILFSYRPSKKLKAPLPPGPTTIPIIGNFIWLFKYASRGIVPVVRELHAKYGSVVTVPVPFCHPTIVIADRSLVHQALVKNGAVFSDRPESQPTIKLISSNQRLIATARGSTWRLLRRNLVSEILNPSRLKSLAGSRKWAMKTLFDSLGKSSSGPGGPVVDVLDHLRLSMTSSFLYMCFGQKVEEAKVREIVDIQHRFLLGLVGEFQILNFGPTWLTKTLFPMRWSRFFRMHDQQTNVMLPLIRTRKKVLAARQEAKYQKEDITAYVDSLMDLDSPDEKRSTYVHEAELANQCSDFLNFAIDTVSITLEWMMANMVKHPHIQEKLYAEIKEVLAGRGVEVVKEEDLHKMKYLKAVVLEGLRRHPPGHILIPHAVTDDFILDGHYAVPKDCCVNFMVAELGWDPKVWAEPMEFKPERFLTDDNEIVEFDITGSKEIKMIPFGAGRRICPGMNLSMLLLEHYVANLVWKFEWKAVEGVGVDLTEKEESSWVMKNPLQAHITPRF